MSNENKINNKGKNKGEGGDKNNEAQLTPVPKQTIIGNPGIKYYFLKKHIPKTFFYDNASGERDEIIYYDGEIHYADELVKAEASFICFGGLKEAGEIFKYAQRINHPRVLIAHFYTFDHDIKKSLVCFEKFNCFLRDIPDTYLTYLNKPNHYLGATSIVTGNPNEFIQSQVREINDALMKMHRTTISSSKLDLESGYFWCARDKMVKIMADELFWCEDEKLVTNADVLRWQNIKDSHVDNFIKGLERYFVNAKTGFRGSHEFVKFLSSNSVMKKNKLLLISTHPFLENQESKIMERFSQIYNWLEARDLNTTYLESAIFAGTFNPDFVPWDVKGMDAGFTRVYKNPKGGGYDALDFMELLRFIRNVYEHRNEVKLSLDDIFEEIQLKWPYLHYHLHEYLLP